jgi:hypothetical protein
MTTKSLGVAEPVFLVLLFVCWILMVVTITGWVGKTAVPGRETDRMIAQAYSGGLALLVWIFLAALLLVASSKGFLPPSLSLAAWVVLPLSGLAALVAIAILYKPQPLWPVLIPFGAPAVIAAYLLYAFLPPFQTISVEKAGFCIFAFVVALSLSILPTAIQFAHENLDDGSIDATPGPKLDQWMAKEKARQRADALGELQKFDEETKLYEVERFARPGSPVRKEALEVMRHLPNREADAILQLQGESSSMLYLFPDIDLQPTPQLCNAAREYLHRAVQHRLAGSSPTGNSFVGSEFGEAIEGIRWVSENCGCDAQLAELEAYARAQDQSAPDVQKFLAALTATKEDKKNPGRLKSAPPR